MMLNNAWGWLLLVACAYRGRVACCTPGRCGLLRKPSQIAIADMCSKAARTWWEDRVEPLNSNPRTPTTKRTSAKRRSSRKYDMKKPKTDSPMLTHNFLTITNRYWPSTNHDQPFLNYHLPALNYYWPTINHCWPFSHDPPRTPVWHPSQTTIS